MKNIRKILAMLLCVAMAFSLAACGPQAAENSAAPEIKGVADKSVQAGTEFDALAGITATDAEDGDLTAKIVVTSLPELTFTNGKATPVAPGDYELTYTVKDSGGKEAKAYATLTVTRQTGEASVLEQMQFGTYTPDSHGWTAKIAEGLDAKAELKQGAYVFEIGNPGNGDGDIQLTLAGLALKKADYRIKIWAKSSAKTYAHLMARNEQAEGWETFGGAYNLVIEPGMKALELFFSSNGEGSAELLLNMGKITPNPENPTDTTPENFTVTIDKIEIYEISGSETQVPVYTNDFSTDGVILSAGDGANGSAFVADGKGVFQIDNYPTEGGIWSIKADIQLPGVTLEAGVKYYYSYTVIADNAQAGECLVESAARAHEARANFSGFAVNAGEEIVVTNVFTAENSVEDPVIRLQIGTPSEGVSSNTIRISNLTFGKVEGDMETVKTSHAFGMSTTLNANPDCLWTTFNGTDEDNELGVGTIWTEDGKLFYRIDQGGTVDWHNKLIFGHRDNTLNLPADAYFTVKITAKASQNVSCGFFLNPVGSWDPRVADRIDFTTEEQTFTFKTTEALIMDMDFEMLFQFGSAETAALGSVTIEITDITIYQESIV